MIIGLMHKKIISLFLTLCIRLYQISISPYIGNNCRFYPSCSKYSIMAIQKYGNIIGIYKTIHRILRCHPWYKSKEIIIYDKP